MLNKIEKFEIELASELGYLYKQLQDTQEKLKDQLINFEININVTNNIDTIRILEARIEMAEKIMDDFQTIFKRGQ